MYVRMHVYVYNVCTIHVLCVSVPTYNMSLQCTVQCDYIHACNITTSASLHVNVGLSMELHVCNVIVDSCMLFSTIVLIYCVSPRRS